MSSVDIISGGILVSNLSISPDSSSTVTNRKLKYDFSRYFSLNSGCLNPRSRDAFNLMLMGLSHSLILFTSAL